MRVGDDARVMQVVGRVGMREETMGDEDVSGFRLDLGEVMTRLDVIIETFERRIEAFRMVIQDVADP